MSVFHHSNLDHGGWGYTGEPYYARDTWLHDRLNEATFDYWTWFKSKKHDALDAIGIIPVAGEWADGLNAYFYYREGDYVNGTLSAAAMIPVIGYGATATKLASKTYKVYNAVDAAGNVRYVGITSREIAVREAEHKAKDAFKELRFLEVGSDMSKIDARIMEQTIINQYGLGPNGGQLLNQINSIAPGNWWMYGIKP